jgi:hypothetical protein
MSQQDCAVVGRRTDGAMRQEDCPIVRRRTNRAMRQKDRAVIWRRTNRTMCHESTVIRRRSHGTMRNGGQSCGDTIRNGATDKRQNNSRANCSTEKYASINCHHCSRSGSRTLNAELVQKHSAH